MAVAEVDLEQQLKEAGNKLLNPPSSSDELVNWLDNVERLLVNVEQAPSRSMQDALLPTMKALISSALLRHSDADVKVSVASCITEITRITAPDAPYNDDQMKVYFQLAVASFERLFHAPGFFYKKSISILETIAKVRSCLLMLDLELDGLIIKMFQHFLKFIRSNHPHSVFLAMETVMTMVIIESEDISLDLLAPLLASTRKESQSVSPMAWKLGEKVLTNCAAKVGMFLKEAVQSVGIDFSEYAPIVASICQDESHTPKLGPVHGSGSHLVVDAIPNSTAKNGTASARNADIALTDNSRECSSIAVCSHSTGAQANGDLQTRMEIEPETVPKKRGRKPNSLMNPEEGYYNSWTKGSKTDKVPCDRKPYNKEICNSPSEIPFCKKVDLSSEHVNVVEHGKSPPKYGEEDLVGSPPPLKQTPPVAGKRKRGRPKKKVATMDQDTEPSLLSSPKVEILSAQVEKKNLESDEASLRKQSKERYTSNSKRKRQSRNDGHAKRTVEDLSITSGNVASKKRIGFPSESEKKPHHSNLGEVDSINNENSLVEVDVKKGISDNCTSDEYVGKASGCKKAKLSNKDGRYLEETPKPAHKRQRTPRKEVAPETLDLGEELVGSRIKVWWPLDRRFYEGVIDSYNPIKKKHRVLYADGDEEKLNLRKQRFELIRDDISPKEGRKTKVVDPGSSSDGMKNAKRKAKSEPIRKQKTSLKRKGVTMVSETKARRSGSRSVNGAQNENTTVGVTSNSESDLENKLKNSTGKSKAEIPSDNEDTPRMTVFPSSDKSRQGHDEHTGVNSKQATSDSTTSTKDRSPGSNLLCDVTIKEAMEEGIGQSSDGTP